MFSVILMEKGGPERRLTFDKEELTIGRISGNDIILPKGNISKRHARLVVKDDKFIVIDLKSTNGTYVNKERISAPRVVGDDDRIYIGDFVMQLVGAGVVIPRSEGNTGRSMAPPSVPPTPPPPLTVRAGRTDQAPPASMLGDGESEAATRAVSLDQIEAEAKRRELAADPEEVELEIEPEEAAVEEVEVEPEEVHELEPAAAPPTSATDDPLDEIEVSAEFEFDEELNEPRTQALGQQIYVPPPPAAVPPRPPVHTPPVVAAEPTPAPLSAQPVVAQPVSAPRSDSVRREAPVEPTPVRAAEPTPARSMAQPEPARSEPSTARSAHAPLPDAARAAVAPRSGEEDGEARFETYVQVLEQLHHRAAAAVFAGLDPDLDLTDEQWSGLETAVGAVVAGARASGIVPPYLDDATLTHDVLYEFTGLGPVEYFLNDDQVSRILVNDFNQILVTADGTTSAVWKSFSSPAALERVVDKLATSLGFGADNRPPVLTGELPDGTAFQALLPPLTTSGPVLSFARQNRRRLTMKALIDQGAIDDADADQLLERIAARANVAVIGRREEDRQAIVGALALFVPEDERVLVIEARQTVALPHRNVTRLRLPTLPEESAQLFRILPQLLSDRLIVGPVSGADAASVAELAHGGAEGLIASLYGRSVDDGLERLARQVVIAGRPSDIEVARGLVKSAIDVVVFVTRDEANYSLQIAHVGT